MKAEVVMTFKKLTKRTAVYENNQPGVACSSVYLDQVGLSLAGFSLADFPQKIKLTVESVD